MIKLNLISPEQLIFLKKKKFFDDIENFLGLIVLTSILISIVLIPFNSSLTFLNEMIIYDKNQSTANNKLLTDRIGVLNLKIDALYAIQSDNYDWTELLRQLANLTPADVSILKFDAQIASSQFNLQGFAKNRDSYLQFKDNLEDAGNFKNLDFPLSDILKKEDITFEIKGLFK